MEHFRILTFKKHFNFISKQQRIIGETSLIRQSYPLRNNNKKCF